MPVPTALERVGNVLAERYILEELLARGGMGVLYLGRHLLTGRRVAVKVMRPGIDEVDPVDAERFLREARAAASLEHPNVVQVFDMGVDQGAWFLVMELLEGESLADHLLRTGPLPLDRALALLLPVMGALATAHDCGVVHRDVKPENVFLARRAGRLVPTLLDFGIAKQVEAHTLTERGMAIGTPMYMSPEQARGDGQVGPPSDVWSMGVVFYGCLTGQLPFDGDSAASVLVKILSQPAPRLVDVARWLPTPVAEVLDRALSSSMQERHADMREFARALVLAAGGHVALPEDPDPVGLPAYRTWTHGLPVVASAPPAPPEPGIETFQATGFGAEAEPPSRSGTRRSSAPPSVFPLLSGRWVGLALGCTLVVAGVLVGWWYLGAAPAASPPVAGELPHVDGPTVTPLSPAPEPSTEEPRVEAPEVQAPEVQAPEAAARPAPPATGPEGSSPPSRERKAHARRERQRARAAKQRRFAPKPSPTPLPTPDVAPGSSGASSPAPVPPPTPGAGPADDPFQIRREYD